MPRYAPFLARLLFGLAFVFGPVLAALSLEPPENPRAEAGLKQLTERFADKSADTEKLRLDIRTFARSYPGTPQAVKALHLLA
jgi:hypothetical protein